MAESTTVKEYTPLKDFRFERKFVASAALYREIEALIKTHPALFCEPFPPRYVNNIYFDSLGLNNFYANIDGVQHRVKCRIRWYGELLGPIASPILELKIKDGLMGKKESFVLQPFTLDENVTIETLRDVFSRSDLPEFVTMAVQPLQPALLNRYRRKYFQTADGAYRLTLDSELVYYRIESYGNTFLRSWRDQKNIIIELKYDRDRDGFAAAISHRFPFRLSRNSKYVNGILYVYGT